MKIIKQAFPLLVSSLFVLPFGSQVSASTLDPISAEEMSRAMLFTSASNGTLQRRGTSETDSSEPTKLEFLGAKAHRFEKSEQGNGYRWADTLVYDYATDELITTVINLETNNVISVKRDRDMQPPLSKNELDRAMDIVFEDDEEFSLLAAEYKKITGEVLRSKQQLDYKAFTFFADSMPNIVNDASKQCGTQRCAQILAYADDLTVMNYSPVINLSAGVITQRISQ